MDNSNINAIISAASGLTGAAIGLTGIWLREVWTARRARASSANYLAIRVVCILDQYIRNCATVVGDDGTDMGQRDQEGCLQVQVPLPDPPSFPTDIDWKSIDSILAYRLLSLPNDIRSADDLIEGANNIALPPDFDELFEEREKQYSALGLKVNKLAEELRARYQVPSRQELKVWEWNPIETLTEAARAVERKRIERIRRMEANPSPFD